jgi:hypothetical protein
MPATRTSLCPVQQDAYARLAGALKTSAIVQLRGAPCSGKSLLAAHLRAESGACIIRPGDLFVRCQGSAQALMEDELLALLDSGFDDNDLVIFEDFDTVLHMVQSNAGYERAFLWAAGFSTLVERAATRGKSLVLTGASFVREDEDIAPFLTAKSAVVSIGPLGLADYAHICDALLPAGLAQELDVYALFEHASKLNPLQLQALAAFVRKHGRTDNAFIRGIVDERLVRATTDINEVEDISFSDLKGFEHIAEQLRTYVLTPLAGDARFAELDLRPKRGVLLYGPPGTGKTSVGRALARQMEGKFFLVDGTVATDPSGAFYYLIQWIFQSAKRAAPAVVFIDDADVLFQSDRGTGLGRYLLTMLDGLESESAGKVAVILTAMEPNHLPAALLRSGRVELWLETKPPALEARAQMLAAYLGASRDVFANYDAAHGARLSDGFNAADLRRLAMDVKAFYARDLLAGEAPAPIESYVEEAIGDIHTARLELARANELRSAPVVRS